MEFKKEIEKILYINDNLNIYEKNKIINNCYLIDGARLCYNFSLSDTRYPYVNDGKTLWCHANGNMALNESSLFTIQDIIEGDANRVAFYLGIKNNELYDFHSLFNLNANYLPKDALRITYFKDAYCIYLLKVDDIVYALRLTLGVDKQTYFELFIKNESNIKKDLYSSMYMNINLLHGNHNCVETKWFRKVSFVNDSYCVSTVEDGENKHVYNYAKLRRCYSNKKVITNTHNTTSRRVYCDSKTNQIHTSRCLHEGKFFEQKYITTFSDIGICGDIINFNLNPNEELLIGYKLSNYINEEEMNNDQLNLTIDYLNKSFDEIETLKDNYWNSKDNLRFNFGRSNQIDNVKFNLFINELVKQVDYCALCKNSTLTMLGVRDIFQAIEAGLIWNKKDARRKILEGLNFLGLNGRSPRQYSLPMNGVKFAYIDDREFIDQDLWIIDAVYQYLSYSNDFEFLNELCGYVEMNNDGIAHILDIKEDVLSHLIRIFDYLINNIDKDTHCLKTLYGDWNDAINGLGKSNKPGEFGNGVSIMATLQLYSDLHKFIDILKHVNVDKYETYINKCLLAIDTLKQGINDNAFVSDNKGNHKILHGWGNNKEFLVGSFNDIDHKERDTLTSNAFYILSDFYKENNIYLKDVLKAYERLDSKYGFKTFDPFFDKDAYKVGRIINLPKGTAENAATYVHATVFALDSLFKINHEEEAWKQIFKIVPITHEFISTTPFIMPNSYLYNPELDCDGESMNDWFTGSSSTLLKSLVKNCFGVQVHLDDIEIHAANYFPFDDASISLKVCKTRINVKYIKVKDPMKQIFINGKVYEELNYVEGKRVIKFDKSDLDDKLEITIQY